MYRHIWAEINLDALRHNINEILKLVPAEKIMGVVKANAYGHGAGMISKELSAAGINKFAVSNVYEALDLRLDKTPGDILILGNVDTSSVLELAENNITVCLYDLEYAKLLNKAAEDFNVKLKCHIKVDTGMGRLGIPFKNLQASDVFKSQIEEIFKLKKLDITGAFTHFATADRDNDETAEFENCQYRNFKAAANIINEVAKMHNKNNLCFHSSNSAATVLDYKTLPSAIYRAGIILYGLTPSANLKLPINLKPVMSLKATVTQIKEVKKGESISYGRTFTADKNIKTAVVTAGYADGFMRGLSNCGEVLINGRSAPVLGRVCMDQTIVDVSNIDNIKNGDTAIIFGDDLRVENLAQKLGTINYELVCAVAHRVPRVYIENGKQIKVVRYRSI